MWADFDQYSNLAIKHFTSKMNYLAFLSKAREIVEIGYDFRYNDTQLDSVV